jgi:hypothetical protein
MISMAAEAAVSSVFGFREMSVDNSTSSGDGGSSIWKHLIYKAKQNCSCNFVIGLLSSLALLAIVLNRPAAPSRWMVND